MGIYGCDCFLVGALTYNNQEMNHEAVVNNMDSEFQFESNVPTHGLMITKLRVGLYKCQYMYMMQASFCPVCTG